MGMYNYCNSYPGGFGPYVTEPPSSSSSSEGECEEWEPDQQWNDWPQQQWAQQWEYQQTYSQWDQGRNLYRKTQCPFYATTGQPLVYYATANTKSPNHHETSKHTEPAKKRQSKKRHGNGGKPNCFVKAFRWYTQDHEPVVPEKKKLADLNVAGFATWLDNKYQEYLHDNHQHDIKLTQTSIIEKPSSCCPCQQRKVSEKCTRLQAKSSNMQAGDTTTSCDEHHQSMEFILAPKEYSQPVSDFIPTPQSCCSESPMNKRIIIKAVDTTGTSPGKETVTQVDVVATQENIPVQTKSKPSIPEKKSNCKKKLRSVGHVSCQCVIKTEQSNAQTQYETSNVTWLETPCSEYCYDSCRITPGISRKTSGTTITGKNEETTLTILKCDIKDLSATTTCSRSQCRDESGQCMAEFVAEATTQYDCCPYCECPTCFKDGMWTCRNRVNMRISTPAPPNSQQPSSAKFALCCARGPPPANIKCSEVCTSEKTIVDTLQVTVTTNQQCSKEASVAYVNNDVQTSDYSITLGENTFGRCYPLFMKIVCADKLCDDIKCGNV